MNCQEEFPFMKKSSDKSDKPLKNVKMNIRIGKISDLLISPIELNRILSPRGDGARDAYERDMSMRDFEDDEDLF